jgi:hypothetical protein
MKDSTLMFILLGVLVLLTVFGYIWLWFIIRRPEKWAVWVDRENDFWVHRGIVSVSFAERMKRIEKGLPQKILVGTVAVLGTGGLIYTGFLLAGSGLLTR